MLALGEAFTGNSALLKHEVAYVLGQMLHEAAVPFLRCSLLHLLQQGSCWMDDVQLSRAAGLACSSCLAAVAGPYYAQPSADKTPCLLCRRVLKDTNEHVMVRHEAAEALGAIADPKCISLLQAHCQDSQPVVADSCRVALDMLAHEQSGQFQYAQ